MAGTASNFHGKFRSFVGKWKQKSDINLRAIGAAKKPDERGSGAAIKAHWRVVFGNLLTLHLLTRA